MYKALNEKTIAFRGSSSDTKPIGKDCSNGNVNFEISVGSTYLEIETSKVFMYKVVETAVANAITKTGSWVEIELGGGGGGGGLPAGTAVAQGLVYNGTTWQVMDEYAGIFTQTTGPIFEYTDDGTTEGKTVVEIIGMTFVKVSDNYIDFPFEKEEDGQKYSEFLLTIKDRDGDEEETLSAKAYDYHYIMETIPEKTLWMPQEPYVFNAKENVIIDIGEGETITFPKGLYFTIFEDGYISKIKNKVTTETKQFKKDYIPLTLSSEAATTGTTLKSVKFGTDTYNIPQGAEQFKISLQYKNESGTIKITSDKSLENIYNAYIANYPIRASISGIQTINSGNLIINYANKTLDNRYTISFTQVNAQVSSSGYVDHTITGQTVDGTDTWSYTELSKARSIDIENKLNKADPEGTGSIKIGAQVYAKHVGQAFGYKTSAVGSYAMAKGRGDKITFDILSNTDYTITVAKPSTYSFEVGNVVAKPELSAFFTITAVDSSQEMYVTLTLDSQVGTALEVGWLLLKGVAKGEASESQGKDTTANGNYSHAEGLDTIANGSYQHVLGKYNIVDTEAKYAEIVGNGEYLPAFARANRSNARTLDWNGNEYLKGNLRAAGLTDGTTTKTMTEILSGSSTAKYTPVTFTETGGVITADKSIAEIIEANNNNALVIGKLNGWIFELNASVSSRTDFYLYFTSIFNPNVSGNNGVNYYIRGTVPITGGSDVWTLTSKTPSEVSGTDDGTNWTSITIDGTTKNIPSSLITDTPTIDGTYTLQVTVTGGVPTYTWVLKQ